MLVAHTTLLEISCRCSIISAGQIYTHLMYTSILTLFVYLFVLIFNVTVNTYSVMSRWVFLGLTSTKQRIKCLAQGHNSVLLVRLDPIPIDLESMHSTIEPPLFSEHNLNFDTAHCHYIHYNIILVSKDNFYLSLEIFAMYLGHGIYSSDLIENSVSVVTNTLGLIGSGNLQKTSYILLLSNYVLYKAIYNKQ